MGDMADYAIDQVVDEEIYRANIWDAGVGSKEWLDHEEEYGHQPQPPIKELDMGVYDMRSLDLQIATIQYQMDSFMLHQYQQADRRRHAAPMDVPAALQKRCAKYATSWGMRAGMAKQIRIYNRPLSEKQSKWMETNYKGGTAAFVSDIMDDVVGPELMYNIVRFSRWVAYVGAGADPVKSWAQATKQTTEEFPDD